MYPVPSAAIGMQLWVGDDGSPETMFRVGRIGDVSGPNRQTDTFETTTHDTEELEDGYKEFESSLKDGGEFTFPIMFDPNSDHHNEAPTVVGTNAGGLMYLQDARAKRNMRFVMPGSPTNRFAFKGLITKVGGDFKVAGAKMCNVTIKISGKPTLEAGGGDDDNP